MKTGLTISLALVVALIAGGGNVRAASNDSILTKVKKFITGTPTPAPKKKSSKSSTSSSKKRSPTPSPRPSASPKPKKSTSPLPTATRTPTPTPKPSPTATPEPSPSESPEETPADTASPSESPSPEPEESVSPSPTPEETPSPTPRPKRSPSPRATSTPTPSASRDRTAPASVASSEVVGYEKYPAAVRKVLDLGLDLTTRNLSYKYGSADPKNGGMDCSGFIHYVLLQTGMKNVPRDAREQYIWVRKAGKFQAVLGRSPDTFELDALKPGDLMFWAGTYNVDRDPGITHTMIYLGREKGSNQRVMIGASDGRTYKGQSRYGVSVFDFKMAGRKVTASNEPGPTFVGYASIPGLEIASESAERSGSDDDEASASSHSANPERREKPKQTPKRSPRDQGEN